MKSVQQNIDQQLASNEGKNLFNKNMASTMHFIPETVMAIEKVGEIDEESEMMLVEYASQKALQEFCRMNQYYTFDTEALTELHEIYAALFLSIKNKKLPINAIAKVHYESLINWLQKSNPFAEAIYALKDETVEPVACSEYSAELQLSILQLNSAQIAEPFLDIGCGTQGHLVKHLTTLGIEAFGFDRFAEDQAFLSHSDWLEYNYGVNKWGTICSNLGFSNHFNHHHLRSDGNFIVYAKKYMDILNALKIGGSFHYAPDLPFIEQYLDPDKYGITKQNVGELKLMSVKITRLK